VRIEICIDMNIYDIALLLQIARASKMPIDALIKKAITEYIEKQVTTTSIESGK